MTPQVLAAAGRLDRVELRSLGAIHLASSFELGDEPDGIVTDDDRLTSAVEGHDVEVVAPG